MYSTYRFILCFYCIFYFIILIVYIVASENPPWGSGNKVCMYVSCGVFIAQLLGGGHTIICRAQGYTSAFYEKLGKTNIYGNVSSKRFAVRY